MRFGKYLALATLLLPLTATAGSYPDKSITMICPYSAGGGGDTATRMVAKLAGDMMGVKINVVNKTGGGATIGIGAGPDAIEMDAELEIRSRRFHELMQHRVREVLLVSSLYDAYILQEDGHLTEQLHIEYDELRQGQARAYDVAPDGQRFISVVRAQKEEPRLHVVMNWFDELGL